MEARVVRPEGLSRSDEKLVFHRSSGQGSLPAVPPLGLADRAATQAISQKSEDVDLELLEESSAINVAVEDRPFVASKPPTASKS